MEGKHPDIPVVDRDSAAPGNASGALGTATASAEEGRDYSLRGISHEFNELFTILQGNLHLIAESVATIDPDTLDMLNEAISAAKDGAALARILERFDDGT